MAYLGLLVAAWFAVFATAIGAADIGVAFFVVTVLAYVLGYIREKRKWNRGVAPCGYPWRHVMTDSQGNSLYDCGWQLDGEVHRIECALGCDRA